MKLLKWLNANAEEYFMCTMLVMMSCVMMLQVVVRYFFGFSFTWAEELSRYCYIFSVAASLGLTVQRGTMLRVGVFVDVFPTKIRHIIRLLFHVVILVCFGILAHSTYTLVVVAFEKKQATTGAISIPMCIMYGSFLVGYLLAIYRQLVVTVGSVRTFGKEELSAIDLVKLEAEEELKMTHVDKDSLKSTEEGGSQK